MHVQMRAGPRGGVSCVQVPKDLFRTCVRPCIRRARSWTLVRHGCSRRLHAEGQREAMPWSAPNGRHDAVVEGGRVRIRNRTALTCASAARSSIHDEACRLPVASLHGTSLHAPEPSTPIAHRCIMITQYDAVAEIEAMKVRTKRVRTPRSNAAAVTADHGWTRANEREIREEMERRLERRTSRS